MLSCITFIIYQKRTLNHPKVRLQLDMFHLQQLEGNLTRNIEKYLPYVGHIQIAQVNSI